MEIFLFFPFYTHTFTRTQKPSHTQELQSRRAFAIYFSLLIDFIAFAINEYRMSYNKSTEKRRDEKKTIASFFGVKQKKGTRMKTNLIIY